AVVHDADYTATREIKLTRRPAAAKVIATPQPEYLLMPTDPPISRRTALQAALAAGTAPALALGAEKARPEAKADDPPASPKRYDMKKSINLWAFPYPQRMNLKECLQLAKDAGFDGVELNYYEEGDYDLSPKAGPEQYAAIRKTAQDIGIAISGV